MQFISTLQGPMITPYRLEVSRQDQGTATMTFYFNGVAQFSATRAGWDDAIPFGSGVYFAEESTRFNLPMWDVINDPAGREGVQLHVAQSASSGNPISASSFGCLVTDGTFLTRISTFIATNGSAPLQINVTNDFPVSLSCSTTVTEIDEGSRVAITVNLNANGTGISKDLYVKIGLAPGSTGSEADFKVLADPVPGTSADDLRSLFGVVNAAKKSLSFESGLYVKIPAGSLSGQIVVDILQDELKEQSETLVFRVEDYAINSPTSDGKERLYSDYLTSPKLLIDQASQAVVTIGDAVTLDIEPIVASGSNFTFVKIAKVIAGHTYTFNFEAYSIPDAITIFDNTQTYINTGLSSGFKSGKITIPKNSDGFLTVRVQGNPDPSTAWDLFVGPNTSGAQNFGFALRPDDTLVDSPEEAGAQAPAILAAGQIAVNEDAIYQLAASQALELNAELVSGKVYALVVIVPPGEEMSPIALVEGSVPAESFQLESTYTSTNIVGFFQADRNEQIKVTINEREGDAGQVRVILQEIAAADVNAFTVGMANRLAQESGDPDADGIAFTIYRIGDVSGEATVSWRLVPDGDNPMSAADFGGTLPSGSVTFAAGRVQEFVQILPAADGLAEAPEGFRIELYAPVQARLAELTIHGQTATVAGTVVDGFDAPILDAGTRFADELYGGPIGDTISGGDGNDMIDGRGGDDQIDGGRGSDSLFGAAGGDAMRGGEGRDRFLYLNLSDASMSAADTILDFESGIDILDASRLNPRNYSLLDLSAGVQLLELNTSSGSLFIRIQGAIGVDDIVGSEIIGSSTGGILIGGAFGDLIVGDSGQDQLYGGGGGDRLRGNGNDDSLFGQAGNDYLTGDLGNDTVSGGAGIDRAGYYQTDAALGGVTVSLLLQGQVQNTGSQGSDSLSEIEQLSGTPFSDRLTGDGASNWLWGSAAYVSDSFTSFTNDDTLNGGGGDDLLTVGTGDHVLVGGTGIDAVGFTEFGGPEPELTVSLANQGVDQFTGSGTWQISGIENLSGGASNDRLTGDGNANVLAGANGSDELSGGGGTDRLLGDGEIATDLGRLGYTGAIATFDDGRGNGDDLLDGGAGADTMIGGVGDDTYVVDEAGDMIVERANQGVDTVRSAISFSLAGRELENLTLTGAATIDGTGNAFNNELKGNSAANVLVGGGGSDLLDGGAGADTMSGGAGNDTYVVDDAGDTVTEISAADGTDLVRSAVTYVLGAFLENLTLIGSAAVDGTGNSLANLLFGNAGNNRIGGGDGNDRLDGGGGVDRLDGGTGDDIYVVDNSADLVVEGAAAGTDLVQSSASFTLGTNVENLTLTGSAAINGNGNGLANVIVGNSADNVLDGGAGTDRLQGGLGNDIYVLDSTADVVVENASAGSDTIKVGFAYTLGTNLENLTLTGAATINGTGNNVANILTGNGAANMLDGGVGSDTMRGGAGNDTYIVDSVGDQAFETSSADGTDLVKSSVSFVLGTNLENLTLTGASAINGTGNGLANILTGNSSANILNGGAGADEMRGGGGDDSYFVDNALDKVIESSATGGIDRVTSSVGFTLGGNVENLTLTGSAAINGNGNGLANILIGNGAANILDGKAGADTMQGGAGNDTYIVDNAGDQAIEVSASHGIDQINASVSLMLAANLENLTLTGTSAINATGNGAANILTGNGAANVLNGAAGADTMNGGLGNDTYVVDNVGDQAIETSATGGMDLVQSSVSFTLGANVENLALTGTAAVNGSGNGLANDLSGNGAANVLNGLAGADTMQGGAGNDTYVVDNVGDQAIEISASHGVDTVNASVSYTLAAKLENLVLTGTSSIDGTGNAAANVLTGNAAKNFLDGGAGSDTLFGGGGADRFVFANTPGATNVDHILDFAPGSDRILLDDGVFTALGAGALPAGALVMGSAATDPNDRILYDAATGALFYDRDGTGAAAAVQFAILDNMPASLAASDFLVI